MSATRIVLAAAAILLLGGCTYDYMQHSDRVAYSAGNAVKANRERETTDPSKDSMYVTKGLGRDGVLVDAEDIALPAQ